MEINEVNTIIDKIYPNQINLKSFNFKKELNPKIWKNGKLKDNIRKRLIKIAKEVTNSVNANGVYHFLSNFFSEK